MNTVLDGGISRPLYQRAAYYANRGWTRPQIMDVLVLTGPQLSRHLSIARAKGLLLRVPPQLPRGIKSTSVAEHVAARTVPVSGLKRTAVLRQLLNA